MEKRYIKAILGLFALFAIGLVGFFAFSAAFGDGLEVTMEEAGVEEGEPLWHAPFSYGEDYFGALLAGILGFVAVVGLTYAYLRTTKKSKKAEE